MRREEAAPLHLTSGDCCGERIAGAGLPGEVLVWRDVLYDGPPRPPGWPDEATLEARTDFLAEATGGGLERAKIERAVRGQYERLRTLPPGRPVVLWFDACLFDLAMLAHVLTCLRHVGARSVELLCIDAFPGIEPYNGLGQLSSEQLASCYRDRRRVDEETHRFAAEVEAAFAARDTARMTALVQRRASPLPGVPAAAARWLLERPDPATGLGRLEQLALDAICGGADTPAAVFAAVAARDITPQFWGDTTLWQKINALAARTPPLVRVDGPTPRLPQWDCGDRMAAYRLSAR